MMNMNMDKKSLMKIITQASFALDDTRLFLDTHPNCQEAILYYNKMQETAARLHGRSILEDLVRLLFTR